ncbi:MAG TPA: PaaI family thioesterase [Candidatus Binataceae bacterium]|nr:PaaI family thioesterase [Candidatus Binataceae bacterium]
MSDRSPMRALSAINQLIRENRVADYAWAGRALGMRPVEFGPGTSRWDWREHPSQVLNPFGTISGGYIGVFVDEMLSTAIGSILEDGEFAVTAEIKLSYLRVLMPGAITGTARVLRRTRSLAFLEASVVSADAEIAATASSTWAISRS